MTETRLQWLGRIAAGLWCRRNSGANHRTGSCVRCVVFAQVPRPPMPQDRMHQIGNTLRPVASTPCDRSQRRPPVRGVADILSAGITYSNLRHCCRHRPTVRHLLSDFFLLFLYQSERLSKKTLSSSANQYHVNLALHSHRKRP